MHIQIIYISTYLYISLYILYTHRKGGKSRTRIHTRTSRSEKTMYTYSHTHLALKKKKSYRHWHTHLALNRLARIVILEVQKGMHLVYCYIYEKIYKSN